MSTSDTLQALLFACCGHPSNLQQLVDAGAVQQLAQGEWANRTHQQLTVTARLGTCQAIGDLF
jgi:hypothetical protein